MCITIPKVADQKLEINIISYPCNNQVFSSYMHRLMLHILRDLLQLIWTHQFQIQFQYTTKYLFCLHGKRYKYNMKTA